MPLLIALTILLTLDCQAKTIVNIGLASNFTELNTLTFNPFAGYFKDAVTLALDENKKELKEKNLEVVIKEFDYGSNDINVIREVKKAVASDVIAVLGYNYSSSALIAAPFHVKYNLPMITPSASANRLSEFGKYVHMASFSNDYMAATLANVAVSKLKARKVLIIPAANCVYCMDLTSSFEQSLKNYSNVNVKIIPILQEEKDFHKLLSQIKFFSFDAVFLPNQELTSARIISALIDAGYKKPFLGADGWGNEGSEFFKVLKGKEFEGYSVTHWRPEVEEEDSKKFVIKYTKKFNKTPNDTAVLAYDATNLLIKALLSTKLLTREGLDNSLASIRSFKGITGNYRYSSNKAPLKEILLLRAKKDSFEIIEKISLEKKVL